MTGWMHTGGDRIVTACLRVRRDAGYRACAAMQDVGDTTGRRTPCHGHLDFSPQSGL